MINPVNTAPPKTTNTSIFYVNDYHGKTINMERTVTASKVFDSFEFSQPTDKLKLSSGDIMLGEIRETNNVATKFLKYIGVTASAMGNHEYDMKPKDAGNLLKDVKYKILAGNVDIAPENPIRPLIEKSYIEEHNGNRYGIIGLSPIDIKYRLKTGQMKNDVNVHSEERTKQDLQAEVNKLRNQGVDKIILLSHVGYELDKKFAREIDGLDVIVGGHSHELIHGIHEGVNLFYNSKTGEPVVITQAGRDGKFFGVLNLEFDDKGVIKKVQNNVSSTRQFKRYAPVRNIFEQIMGKPKVIGRVNWAPPPPANELIDPNPHVYFLVDCMKEQTKADIALLNAANVRGYFESGNLDTRVLEDINPFKNKVAVIKYSEKELVDAMKYSAKSVVTENNKPGLFFASGLKYTVNKKGELNSLTFVAKSGREWDININKPRTDTFYTVAIPDFHATGGDGFTMLNKMDKAEKVYDCDITKLVEDWFKTRSKPVDILDDGRFRLVG